MDLELFVDLLNEWDTFLVIALKMIFTFAHEGIIPYRIGKEIVKMDVTVEQAEKTIVIKQFISNKWILLIIKIELNFSLN